MYTRIQLHTVLKYFSILSKYACFHFVFKSVDGRLWDEFCGLSSSIPFNGTIYGESCTGTVSDWDDDGCVIRGNLALRSNTCRNLQPPMGKLNRNVYL